MSMIQKTPSAVIIMQIPSDQNIKIKKTDR